MPQPLQGLQTFVPTLEFPGVRRVGVIPGVAVRVMATVPGRPVQDAPLRRHRAEDGQRQPQRPPRLEGPVGEIAVEPDFDSDARQEVHARQQPDIQRVNARGEGVTGGGDGAEEGDEHSGQGHPSLGVPERAVVDGDRRPAV